MGLIRPEKRPVSLRRTALPTENGALGGGEGGAVDTGGLLARDAYGRLNGADERRPKKSCSCAHCNLSFWSGRLTSSVQDIVHNGWSIIPPYSGGLVWPPDNTHNTYRRGRAALDLLVEFGVSCYIGHDIVMAHRLLDRRGQHAVGVPAHFVLHDVTAHRREPRPSP